MPIGFDSSENKLIHHVECPESTIFEPSQIIVRVLVHLCQSYSTTHSYSLSAPIIQRPKLSCPTDSFLPHMHSHGTWNVRNLFSKNAVKSLYVSQFICANLTSPIKITAGQHQLFHRPQLSYPTRSFCQHMDLYTTWNV